MTSQYSVVHFIPNLASGEQINVGVVAFDDQGNVAAHVLENWSRVKLFANLRDVTHVQDAVKRILENATADEIRSAVSDLGYSIQLSPLRGSTEDLGQLMNWASSTLLVDREEHKRPQIKKGIQRKAIFSLREKFAEKLGSRDIEVNPSDVAGKVAKHPIDVTVRNGKLLVAAPVISMAGSLTAVRHTVGECAWILQDLQAASAAERLAVLIPTGDDKHLEILDEIHKIFPAYNAEVVEDRDITSWADHLAEELASVA